MSDTQTDEKIKVPQQKEFIGIIEAAGGNYIPADHYEIPSEFDLSGCPPPIEFTLESGIDAYREYLGFPLIKDEFDTHRQRRAWRTDTYKQLESTKGKKTADAFNAFYEENKFRRNTISTLYSATTTVLYQMERTGYQNPQLEEQLRGLVSSIQDTMPKKTQTIDDEGMPTTITTDPWDGPVNKWKEDKVNEISGRLVGILHYLGKKE